MTQSKSQPSSWLFAFALSLAGLLAGKRVVGRASTGLLLGLFLGPLGWLILILLSPVASHCCPWRRGDVDGEATVCPHCSREFADWNRQQMTEAAQ